MADYYLYEVTDGKVYDWDHSLLPPGTLDELKVGDFVRLLVCDTKSEAWEKIYFQIRAIDGQTLLGEAKPNYRMEYPRERINDGEVIPFERKHVIEIPLSWNEDPSTMVAEISEPCEQERSLLAELIIATGYPLNGFSNSSDVELGGYGYFVRDGHITQLGVDLSTLPRLPPCLLQLKHLERLVISGGKYSALPGEISHLQVLRHLYIYNARDLNTLPPTIGQLEHLKELDLVNCPIKEIPPEIGQLAQLRRLRIVGGQFKALPASLGNLHSLVELSLARGELECLPESLGNLLSLEILDLLNNRIKILPPTIGNLGNLKRLVLERNNLTKLPIEIGQLTQLESLELGNFSPTDEVSNQFDTLPACIGQLKQLGDLWLDSCGLKTLPPEIGGCGKLEMLGLRNNKLTELPVEICQLQMLTDLDVNNNQLRTLPENLAQLKMLKRLNVKDNRLTRFPPHMEDLLLLERVEIEGNPWEEVPPHILVLAGVDEELKQTYLKIEKGPKQGETVIHRGKKFEDGKIDWDKGDPSHY